MFFVFVLSPYKAKRLRVLPTRGDAYRRGYVLGKTSVLLCSIYKPHISRFNSLIVINVMFCFILNAFNSFLWQENKTCANCVILHGYPHRRTAFTKNKLFNKWSSSFRRVIFLNIRSRRLVHKNNASVLIFNLQKCTVKCQTNGILNSFSLIFESEKKTVFKLQ